MSLADAAAFVAQHKAQGRTVALCNGAFDLLHVGHLRYLQGARALADAVVVAVNSDSSVRASKGPARPAIPQAERLELVAALRCVDHAFVFDTDTVAEVLSALRPTYHCKGTDYTEASVPEAATSAALGIITKIVGDPKDHSTTAILGEALMLVLDGPIGTYLIARGVLPHRVWRAALDVPDLVVAAHRAYLSAGARVLLTNTFALPSVALRERLDDHAIAECMDTALDLALKAAEPAHSATIHINLGPTGADDAAAAQGVMQRILASAAARIKHGRAVSVWFETFSERDALWLRPLLPALKGVPFALSFLLTDAPPRDLAALCEGAWAAGCNCSSFKSKDSTRMQHALHAWSLAPLPPTCKRIAKPALGGTGDVIMPHAERLGFDLVGACCGGTVADIASLSGTAVLQ